LIMSLMLLKKGKCEQVAAPVFIPLLKRPESPRKKRRTSLLEDLPSSKAESVSSSSSEAEDLELFNADEDSECDSNLELDEMDIELEDEYREKNKKRSKRRGNRSNRTWMECFNDIKRTIDETGKWPTFQTKNVHIWRWLDEQCELYETNRMSKEHIDLLANVGFDFVKSENKKMPTRVNKKRFPLSSWIHAQRTQRRKGKLSKNRVKMLNKIGFIWEPMKNEPFEMEPEITSASDDEADFHAEIKRLSPQEQQRELMWLDNYRQLKEFKKKYGHLRVPTDWESAKDYFEE